MMRLKNKVAIITGSARGIGKTIANKLAQEGAAVVIADIILDKAEQVANEITKQGGTAIAVKVDVTNTESVKNLVDVTLQKLNGVHILVNNAGVARSLPLVQTNKEDWDFVLNVDLGGVFNCTKIILSLMMEQKYGKIINIASVAGFHAPVIYSASYNTAKAGVIQFTKSIAMEAGEYGINVNAIAPGFIETDIFKEFMTPEQRARFETDYFSHSALKRVGQPTDIANLAFFLVTDDSSYITGQTICCDGGHFIGNLFPG